MRSCNRLLAIAVMLAAPDVAAAQGAVAGTVRVGRVVVGDVVLSLAPVIPRRFSPAGDTALIDQVHLSFLPGVLAVQEGTIVAFLNSDPIMHNVFSPGRNGPSFNLGTYRRGESRFHTFKVGGQHVILCHVHPEMAAWVVVVPTPYFSTSDEDGTFRIEGVPSGRYRVTLWHRRWGDEEWELSVPADGLDGLEITFGRGRTDSGVAR